MICYIGVGSNAGDRPGYINKAFDFLKVTPGVKIKKISSVCETRPQGGPKGQGDYLNCVIKITTYLSPKKLLRVLKNTERKVGRKPRKKRWSRREIDLDILLYGEKVVRHKELIVPHPQLSKRVSVLRPLSELAPSLRHPVTGEPIKTLYKNVRTKDARP